LEIATHRAVMGSRTVYNTKVDLLPKVGPKEMYRTSCYSELECRLVTKMPYEQAADFMNRMRCQDDEEIIKCRTLADSTVREGAQIIDYINAKAQDILARNHFDCESGKPDRGHSISKDTECPEVHLIPRDEIDNAIDEYNQDREREKQIDECQIHEVFESPESCVNISIDDVGVTQQKEEGRSKNSPPKESRHYVKNTVIHIQQQSLKYVLAGLGIKHMLKILVAFMLNNNLFDNKTLIFFTDGADNIKNAIRDIFGWRPYRIILDWYHLRKKCKERLSMAMKGREIRNEVLKELLSLLWLGKVDVAVEFLRSLEPTKIKNKEHIEKLIAYFDRNWNYIPCYALRKKLGLRVSSNRGEKANDLVVAKRQKHNGMSWSKPGSSGLANITALFLNKESENWLTRRMLDFKLVPAGRKKAA